MARAPAQAETADAASVRAFYDEFSSSRMQSYLLETNLRIEKAIERVLPFVAADSRVLEIGCGLGLITERMAQVAVRGGIWACDLSEKNVESAKQRLCGENVHFRTADVLREFDELRAWIAQPVDLVVMVDVLEHLPIGTHPAVFRNLRSVMGERATLVITYPSPQYQQYLRQHKPEELQIIDETIDLPHLLQVSSANGFWIKHFSSEDVWFENQYLHCVLTTDLPLAPIKAPEVEQARREIARLVPAGAAFILVDEEQWGMAGTLGDRRVVPFLERDGQYWGPPADDETAISELERLRSEGATHIVFAKPAFWWLECYAGLTRHLREEFECVFETDNVVVFRL